jgi:transglutaminase-like putative cysteine protease
MNRINVLLSLIIVLVAGLTTTVYVSATPSANLEPRNGDVFDDWEVCRTRAFGEDGFYQITETTFRPVIAFESMGENAELAYSLGEQFAEEYPDQLQRAKQVFYFVRDRVRYTPDIDQFKYEEFALNADELASTIVQKGLGRGDCEDSAVLLAVMYQGAGYRSAIVVGGGHTAVLVYLPEYNKATTVFALEGEPGWVWAEATGKNNPLGWVPKEFINVEVAAYEVKAETVATGKPAASPSTAITTTGKTTSSQPFPFFSIILLLWLLPLFRRRRAR